MTPPTPLLRSAAALGLAASLVGACTGSIVGPVGDPSGIVGTFVLTSVDGGRPIPAVAMLGGLPLGVELKADTLVLDDRTWSRVTHRRTGELDTGPYSDQRAASGGFLLRRDDGRFLLAFECDDTGDCISAEVFEQRGDTIVIDQSADLLFRDLRFLPVASS